MSDKKQYLLYEKTLEMLHQNQKFDKNIFKLLTHQQKFNVISQAFIFNQKENIKDMLLLISLNEKENETIWINVLNSHDTKNLDSLSFLKVSQEFLMSQSSKYINKIMRKSDDSIADYIQMYPAIFLKKVKTASLYAIKNECKKSAELLSYLSQTKENQIFFLSNLIVFDKIHWLSEFKNKPFVEEVNHLINDKNELFDYFQKKKIKVDVNNLNHMFNHYICDFIQKELDIQEQQNIKKKIKKL